MSPHSTKSDRMMTRKLILLVFTTSAFDLQQCLFIVWFLRRLILHLLTLNSFLLFLESEWSYSTSDILTSWVQCDTERCFLLFGIVALVSWCLFDVLLVVFVVWTFGPSEPQPSFFPFRWCPSCHNIRILYVWFPSQFFTVPVQNLSYLLIYTYWVVCAIATCTLHIHTSESGQKWDRQNKPTMVNANARWWWRHDGENVSQKKKKLRLLSYSMSYEKRMTSKNRPRKEERKKKPLTSQKVNQKFSQRPQTTKEIVAFWLYVGINEVFSTSTTLALATLWSSIQSTFFCLPPWLLKERNVSESIISNTTDNNINKKQPLTNKTCTNGILAMECTNKQHNDANYEVKRLNILNAIRDGWQTNEPNGGKQEMKTGFPTSIQFSEKEGWGSDHWFSTIRTTIQKESLHSVRSWPKRQCRQRRRLSDYFLQLDPSWPYKPVESRWFVHWPLIQKRRQYRQCWRRRWKKNSPD